jgi:succinate-acetate transporter protein
VLPHDQDRADSLPARVVLRPVGNPLPFGLLGLTVATLVLTGLNLGWIPTSEQHQVAIVLVAFAFPVQAVATVFGFLSRDVVVASGIGVQGASWFTIGLILLTSAPGSTSAVLGLFLFVAAAALASAVIVALASKVVPALVMAGTAARFVMTGVFERTGAVGWEHASGWEGAGLAGLALYAAFALDLESTHRRTVLPLLRRGEGKVALDGDAAAQVAGIDHEAGVREQL